MKLYILIISILFSSLLFAEAPKISSHLSMQELNKLTADTPSANSYLGYSVAISGTTAVVGAYGYNTYAGAAYVYEYNTTSKLFVQSARLEAFSPAASDNFGRSVAISVDTIVIGAYGDDDVGSKSGSAYIFKKPLLGWATDTEDAKITASDAAAVDRFGSSVAISGDTIVVGAYRDDDDGSDSGSAYIFEKPLLGWATDTEDAKITASDVAAHDYFGLSVAISGDTIVVGAYRDDDNGSDSGSAYIFEKPLSGWTTDTENAKITASDAASGDRFGASVAICGDTIVVGAYYNDDNGSDSGSAYIFEKPPSGWATDTEDAKITASDAGAVDQFGFSVAISVDTIVVGAYLNNDSGFNSGSAYIFEKPLSGWATGTEDAKITASDAAGSDYFGISVAISGDTIVVGAYGDDDGGASNSGSAYIFKSKGYQGISPSTIMYLLN